jgi:hypothetical protein
MAWPVYTLATHNRPQLYTGYAVFQGGIPFGRTIDLAGGGNVVPRNWQGTSLPMLADYATRVADLSGGGTVPARPGFFSGLLPNPFRQGGG